MDCPDCRLDSDGVVQRKVLLALLLINGLMFIGEIIVGALAESTGLIADSLDMLADAFVYAVSLYAVGMSNRTKISAAKLSGLCQIVLAAGVIIDVSRRLVFGSDPKSVLILCMGTAALAANLLCLRLIATHRRGEVHMRASWIFSKNDVLANFGVLVAGVTVHLTGTRWPDLIVGVAIAVIVLRGGLHILRDAASENSRKE